MVQLLGLFRQFRPGSIRTRLERLLPTHGGDGPHSNEYIEEASQRLDTGDDRGATDEQSDTDTQVRLSVAMFPDYTDSNPYQQELATALEDSGVAVTLSGYSANVSLFDTDGRDGDVDVVHLHWLSSSFIRDSTLASALLGIRLLANLLALRLAGVTVVWTVHNLYEHDQRAPRVESVVKGLASRFVDKFLVHCNSARESVIDAFSLSAKRREDVVIVPHGHYIDSYPNDVSYEDARAAFGYEDETVFLFFGLVRPYKNVTRLIETFRDLDTRDTRLLVVGNPLDDELGEAVRDLAASDDRVDVTLEFVPVPEVQNYMNVADAVVLPYDDTFMSGAAILAMSFGRPVVAPDAGCIDDLLPAESNFCFDATDPDGLSNALETALDADLTAMGTQNRRDIERFDWAAITCRTLGVYESARER